MSDEQENVNIVARERADQRIDAAVGELHKAATEIGKKFDIPDGINGMSVDELLGRMSYIPTMARDLRRACGQELAKQEINKMIEGVSQAPAATENPAGATENGPDATTGTQPATIPHGLDVADLDGISPQTVKALKAAGLNNVGDVVDVPDEHLVKINGLGEISVNHLRAAIAKASA